ncbi:MAG: dihydrofolate reductase family protein [Actinophytocola sp.]|uniref:dihydrofolate reductase family protein n=1 Tax=Actinophytocola sp. TaxID=1872138 RepID=UPI003D6BDDD7
MTKVVCGMSMSLDGYVTGPNDSREHPLGEGGEPLHHWLFSPYQTEPDAEVIGEMLAGVGAVVMGRRSFDFCEGEGGWGDGGPAGDVPCFVVTHRPPPAHAASVFTFVDDVPSAIEQAKAAAGDKVVGMHGATTTQQALAAGLLDELQIHLIPILLGGGVRLLEHLGDETIELEPLRVVGTPRATHLRYRVLR